MIIFLILLFIILILINLPIKIFILIEINNFDIFWKIKFAFVEIKRSKRLKFKANKNKKRLKIDLRKILKYADVKKINLDINVGTPFLFLNIYTTPILSIVLESFKNAYLRKLKNYSYKITPDFENFIFNFKGEFVLNCSILNFIMYYFDTPKKQCR